MPHWEIRQGLLECSIERRWRRVAIPHRHIEHALAPRQIERGTRQTTFAHVLCQAHPRKIGEHPPELPFGARRKRRRTRDIDVTVKMLLYVVHRGIQPFYPAHRVTILPKTSMGQCVFSILALTERTMRACSKVRLAAPPSIHPDRPATPCGQRRNCSFPAMLATPFLATFFPSRKCLFPAARHAL